MFIEHYDITNLRPASYNPRQIDEESLALLRQSLQTIGVAKPIIATTTGTIIAGHQRTRSLKACGITVAPVYLLDAVDTSDEIRFNQLHNGTDLDTGDEQARVPAGLSFGYSDVPAQHITGNLRSSGATIRAEICRLLTRYGSWGGAVVNNHGRVISGAQYALACKILGIACRVYCIPVEQTEYAYGLFQRPYGTFSYEHLPRTTYAQTFAQMFRLRGTKRDNKSPIYEQLVIPSLKKHEWVLDFGCGQGDYVQMLQRLGYSILGVEFFYRQGNGIATGKVHAMIDALAHHITTHGLFDVVVCDYVLNSTDSMQAQADVMTCVNAFCKPQGRVYFSGRPFAFIDGAKNRTISTQKGRAIEFLDANGHTALYRNGNWFYQKFHTTDEIRDLVHTYFADTYLYQAKSSRWQVSCIKHKELPLAQRRAAIEREFNLMWPNGKSVNRGAMMVGAYQQVLRNMQPQTDSSDTL